MEKLYPISNFSQPVPALAFTHGPGSSSKIFWMAVSLVFSPGPGFVGDGKSALKIAQPFMAGLLAHGHHKVPSGTKENAALSQLSSVPAGTLKFGGRFAQP